MTTLNLTSTAFGEGAFIPPKYTCDAENLSPPLSWSGIPVGAQSLALIVDDPDAPAGTWVHWVLFDLSPGLTGLEEGASQKVTLENLGVHGTNDFRKPGYGGPCPPPGKAHRYFFKLYALDAPLELKPGVTKGAVELAMQGHILVQGQLMGKYKR